jgi:hypothetical protein
MLCDSRICGWLGYNSFAFYNAKLILSEIPLSLKDLNISLVTPKFDPPYRLIAISIILKACLHRGA